MADKTTKAQLYSSANFLLELGDAKARANTAAVLRSIDGGFAKTEVISYANHADGVTHKLNGKVKYEPIKLVAGLAAGAELWEWMQTFLDGTCHRQNGALVAACHDYYERARRSFSDAIIESIEFPKVDANDKNPANLTITIHPEEVKQEQANTSNKINANAPGLTRQPQLASCNFTFVVDGLIDDNVRVAKVDGFAVKTKIIEYHHGQRVNPIKLSGKIEMPTLVFYVPEVDAKPAYDLQKKYQSGEPAPLTHAQLTYLNNAREPKGTVEFFGCRVTNVQPDKNDTSAEDARLVKIEMTVERIEVKMN
jgi:hypothetical protein